MLRPKNGSLPLEGGRMSYIRFGSGPKKMVLIPGVGDGLTTVRGMAVPFALMYRKLARAFTVWVFSRREPLEEHFTTRRMAEDLAGAMDALGIGSASVVGVSQGGMIAQWLAADRPEKVERLVLAVTAARPNPVMEEAIGQWTRMAERGDYRGIMLDTAERSYTPAKARASKLAYAALGSVGKPKSFRRFLIQAESCLTHDASDALGSIACPTLVIGGTKDAVLTGEASRELAERIPGAELYLYEGLSHGLYEEAPDFLDRVRAFCEA